MKEYKVINEILPLIQVSQIQPLLTVLCTILEILTYTYIHIHFTFFFLYVYKPYYGLPWWLSSEESICQCRRHKFDPQVRKISWQRKWQPAPVFLPGKLHGQRSLVGYSQWDCNESDITQQLNNNKAILQMIPKEDYTIDH